MMSMRIRLLPSLLAVVLACGVLAGVAAPASAQDDRTGESYITPFPEGDVYKLQVVGDGFAEGVLDGLVEALGSDSRLQINRKRRVVGAIVRGDGDDGFKALDEVLAKEPSHVSVVMLGRDDRQPIRLANRRLDAGSDGWREAYGQRVDQLMKLLKRRGGAVYWIGLPVVQRRDANELVQLVNDIVRDRANANAIRFIDAYAGFADENGSFVAMGPDAAGLVRRLREGDGVSFTAAGNRKLAHFVEREVRRDLTEAKANRNIPLAGSEVDQRKINPPKPSPASPAATGAQPKSADGTKSGWAASTSAAAPGQPAAVLGDQKADNSRITLRAVNAQGREETTMIDILRPAIPASVVQLIARNSSPDRATPVGDTVLGTLPGGLLTMSSVSPSGDGGSGGRRGKFAPTQTPYFRVMVKGERIPSKPGRADEFSWPRPGDEPAPPAAKSGAPVR